VASIAAVNRRSEDAQVDAYRRVGFIAVQALHEWAVYGFQLNDPASRLLCARDRGLKRLGKMSIDLTIEWHC
jgi:hypothetical protein